MVLILIFGEVLGLYGCVNLMIKHLFGIYANNIL